MSITAKCALTTGAGRAIGHAMAVRLAPDDVASFVFFVAGPDPDYMTGQSGLIARAGVPVIAAQLYATLATRNAHHI
jgi:NAD(P)-dependent dehydrogenase (short-subunit alcohol dehydrogenase family)